MTPGYAVAKPRLELLEVLAGIAAYQDAQWRGKGPRWGRAGAWCIVRQSAIMAWYTRMLVRFGRPAKAATICRRTLNYQLAGLERDRYIAREQRHTSHRRGKLDLRPSLYKFTSLGRLWIKRRLGWVTNPLDLVAVQKLAQSGFNSEVNSLNSLSRAVDKSSTARGAPRRGKRRQVQRHTASSIHVDMQRPRKALDKVGAQSGGPGNTPKAGKGRTRKATAPRASAPTGRRKGRRR